MLEQVRHKNKFRDYAYMLFVGHEAEHGETLDPHEKEEASDERQIALAAVNDIASVYLVGISVCCAVPLNVLCGQLFVGVSKITVFAMVHVPQSSCARPCRTWQAMLLERSASFRSPASRALL